MLFRSGDQDLDALGTDSHGTCGGSLDGTTVRNTAFNLLGDCAGDDVSVEFGSLDLVDVDLDLLACQLDELFLQLVDLFTTLADDHARTCGENGDGDVLQGTFDGDL